MPAVTIVSDTTHYLPRELVAAKGIHEVSLYVNDADGTQRESEMPNFDAFYDKLVTAAEVPTTSQPSIGDFLAVYEPLLDAGQDIVSVHLSGGISGTMESARQAAEEALKSRPDRQIEVVDSRSAAGGQGLIVLAGAAAANGGADPATVAARVTAASENITSWFAVDTLEFLRRGGRIGTAQAWLGGALKIKPILSIGYEVEPIERVRTWGRAFERLVTLAETRKEIGATSLGRTAHPRVRSGRAPGRAGNRDLRPRARVLLGDRSRPRHACRAGHDRVRQHRTGAAGVRRRHRFWLAATLAVGTAAAAPSPVAALQTGALTPAEQEQLSLESALIGRGHALEHIARQQSADQRARQEPVQPGPPAPTQAGTPQGTFDPCRARGPGLTFDFTRPLPPVDKPTGQTRCAKLPTQPKSRSALARNGRWSKKYLDLPHYAIHAAQLPTGKVLFYGFQWTQHIITQDPNKPLVSSSDATIWDPAKGTSARAFKQVPAPLVDIDGDGSAERVPLYCSGLTFLADGRLLVSGGTLDLRWAALGYTNPPGIKFNLIFDPKTERWSRGPDMSVARWYPTDVKLADGRVLILGGYGDDKPTNLTKTLELVSADGRRVEHVATGDRLTWTYPGMLLMPSGRVLLAGPSANDTGLFDPESRRWSAIKNLPAPRGGGNIVAVPSRTGRSPQAMLIGGLDFLKPLARVPSTPAYKTTLTFDDRNARAGFKSAPSQRVGRNWPNTVLLPDGSMVTIGGGIRHDNVDGPSASTAANRRVELWNPRTRKWRLGPQQRENRTYHSVAVLMPDGRVWSSGDDTNPNRDGDTAEIYEPSYLFRGARPRVIAAPKSVTPGKRFTLTVRGSVKRVTALAPSATTHALDMNQRFVELKIVSRKKLASGATRLTVDGPLSSAAAPPGPWMLFALGDRDAPSIARWTTVKYRR